MNPTKKILILGSGHLAYRIKKLAVSKNYEVVSFGEDVFQLGDTNTSSYDKIQFVLKDTNLALYDMLDALSRGLEFF